MLLPLGFNQGPGQALTFGASWEVTGLENGGDRTISLLWALPAPFLLDPLRFMGRKRLVESRTFAAEDVKEQGEGGKDLVGHIALLAGVYFLTYLFLETVTSSLVGKENGDDAWGLHFVFVFYCLCCSLWASKNILFSIILKHSWEI